MHTMITKRPNWIAMLALMASTLLVHPLQGYAVGNQAAGEICSPEKVKSLEVRLNNLERRVRLLEMDSVTYGPITVEHIHLNHQRHFTTVAPGEIFECSFHYKLDSSQQEFLSKNHLIVGIQGIAAETCATHLYGVWNSAGPAKFNLMAPLQEGDYEVRIAYRPGDTCEDAINTWNVLGDEPGSFATIGVIRVQRPPVNVLQP